MLKSSKVKNLEQKADQANVSELMAKAFMNREVIKVNHNDRISAVIKILQTHKLSGVPVVNDYGHLVGIITQYDLLLQAASKDLDSPIEYTKNPISVRPEITLKELLILFYQKKIRRVPVIDERKNIVGIVSRMNILERLVDRQG